MSSSRMHFRRHSKAVSHPWRSEHVDLHRAAARARFAVGPQTPLSLPPGLPPRLLQLRAAFELCAPQGSPFGLPDGFGIRKADVAGARDGQRRQRRGGVAGVAVDTDTAAVSGWAVNEWAVVDGAALSGGSGALSRCGARGGARLGGVWEPTSTREPSVCGRCVWSAVPAGRGLRIHLRIQDCLRLFRPCRSRPYGRTLSCQY
mmetsp:Transcript_41790/g.103108  ORF Transcript_41790/g.103108 Transcript_41790/m.103108 type:complete len:203 (-) Transcript_41790:3009-3617(-)